MISSITRSLHRELNDENYTGNESPAPTTKSHRIKKVLKGINLKKLFKITYETLLKSIENEPKNERKARFLLKKFSALKNTDRSPKYLIDLLNNVIVEAGFGGRTFCEAYYQRSVCNFRSNHFVPALSDVNIALKYSKNNDKFESKCSRLRKSIIFCRNLKHLDISIDSTKILDQNQLDSIENDQILSKLATNDYDIDAIDSSKESIELNFRIDPRIELIIDDRNKGRHLTCREPISSNEEVLMEKSYSLAFDRNFLKKFCSNCYRKCTDHFVPCKYCRSVVYCDENCCRQSWLNDHRFECLLMSVFNRDHNNISIHMYRIITRIGLKNVLTIKQFYDEMIQQQSTRKYSEYVQSYINQIVIKKYLNNSRIQHSPWFELKFSDKNLSYQMLLTLLDHNDRFETYYDHQYMGLAIDTALLLIINDYLTKDQPKESILRPHFADLPRIQSKSINNGKLLHYSFEDFVILIEILLFNIRKLTTNIFAWTYYGPYDDYDADDESLSGQCVATCQCLLGSFINHSCEPNVEWEFRDGRIVFTTNREIEPGEEINISYGPTSDQPFIDRQTQMFQNYYFNCRCQLCLREVESYDHVLKCEHCSGPVVVLPGSDSDSECMKCWKPYPMAIKHMNFIDEMFQKFFILNLEWINDDGGCNLSILGQMNECSQQQCRYLYGKNAKLIENFMILIHLSANSGQYQLAFELLSKLNRIDSGIIFNNQIDDENWHHLYKNQYIFNEIAQSYSNDSILAEKIIETFQKNLSIFNEKLSRLIND